jgi:hypothetical protein
VDYDQAVEARVMNKTTFAALPNGARFKFFGKAYTKLAPSMAEDENRHGHIFGHTEFRSAS